MIGLVAVTAAGKQAAATLANRWSETKPYLGQRPGDALRQAFAECDQVVCFLAVGATVRLIAPLLRGRDTTPGLVCVDEQRRYAVPVLGGHSGAANELADRVADELGGTAVITTATDARNLPGLDTLGWATEGAVASVTRAILDGEPVRLSSDAIWPLPAFPANVGATGSHRIVITDRQVSLDGRTVVLRPPALQVGLGASRGVSSAEILALIDSAVNAAGLSPLAIAQLCTVDVKAAEPGIVEAARLRSWPVLTYPAERLAEIDVPHPSDLVRRKIGTPSVAEAAALAGGGELVVAKQKSRRATVAVARVRPRGRLALVGLGPGARDLLTPRAVTELRRCSVVVGLDQYVDQIRDLLRPGTRVDTYSLGEERQRARAAVRLAEDGHAVALVGSGDTGVYAMAAPALEEAGQNIDVVPVPGVTAALSAAALLGAPLGHDHAAVSLSDLHTPWEVIERRVRAAAEGDFVITFYNPRSRNRDWQLSKALGIVAGHRPPQTPVGVVRAAERPDQTIMMTTLADLDVSTVDMVTTVVVGSSQTRIVNGRMVTPRGYRWES